MFKIKILVEIHLGFDLVFRIRIRIQGVFWIRIRNPDPDPGASKKFKKRSKMLNNHDIILLFSDFYSILSFN